METAIVSIICIALIVFGGMTMSQGFITSVDTSTAGLEEISQRDETMIRTELTPRDTDMPSIDTLELTLENTGQTRLSDYEAWDIIVQYYDGTGTYHVEWLPYTGETLSDNKWEVVWIRLNGGNEIFEPGVLNPEEEIMVRAQLYPSVGANTTNMVVTSTPSGVTASTYFSP
jgi:hypothetical protein